MPNRLIKESICTSQNLNELLPEEEIFFYRLLVNCDDYGRMDGRSAILRARCFPLRTDSIKEAQIVKWLQCLAEHELLDIYETGGQRYLQIKTWEKHQQIRAKRSKFPDPNGNMIAIDGIGNQVITDVSKCPRNPIQSESNPNPIQEEKLSPERKKIEFEEYVEELRVEYPDLNFNKELNKFHLYWSEGNRKLQRPKSALTNWMDKAREFKQEGKGGKGQQNPRPLPKQYTKPEDL